MMTIAEQIVELENDREKICDYYIQGEDFNLGKALKKIDNKIHRLELKKSFLNFWRKLAG